MSCEFGAGKDEQIWARIVILVILVILTDDKDVFPKTSTRGGFDSGESHPFGTSK